MKCEHIVAYRVDTPEGEVEICGGCGATRNTDCGGWQLPPKVAQLEAELASVKEELADWKESHARVMEAKLRMEKRIAALEVALHNCLNPEPMNEKEPPTLTDGYMSYVEEKPK